MSEQNEIEVTKYMTVEEAAKMPNMLGVLASIALKHNGEYRYHHQGEHVTLKLKK